MTHNERFRAHVEECEQCRNRPMRLCWIGSLLIQAAGQETAQQLADRINRATEAAGEN